MTFAFVAYTIIFLGIAWYVFNIGQQHQKLTREIEALEAALAPGNAGIRPASGSGGGGPQAGGGTAAGGRRGNTGRA